MDLDHAALSDYEFSYSDRLGRRATHRVRIFTPGTWTAVLITDCSEKHHCPSVTNSVEELIDALLLTHPVIRRERLVVIEHYDDRSSWRPFVAGAAMSAAKETFDLVSFSYGTDGHACNPNWNRVTKADAERWTGSTLP